MSAVRPVHKELTVGGKLPEVSHAILKRVRELNGKVLRSDDNTFECDFGSLLQSRLIGEFWVSKATLPKKAVIILQASSNGGTQIKLDITDTHKYGFKLGYITKYEEALQELAESLLSAIQ